MSEPYLVLHRVRGQPAFDIAERICHGPAPCQQNCEHWNGEVCQADEENWWIIPTSGHRAYPYWQAPLNHLVDMYYEDGNVDKPLNIPADWPDHYPTTASPHTPNPSAPSLAQRLGLVPKTPPITRRL